MTLAQEITANIQALKDMSGRDLRDTDKFTFTITPQDGAPATTTAEAQNGGQDNKVIDFGYATFTEDGTYTYLITETGGSVAGVTNSTQTIKATVQVDYNEATGTLSSEVNDYFIILISQKDIVVNRRRLFSTKQINKSKLIY